MPAGKGKLRAGALVSTVLIGPIEQDKLQRCCLPKHSRAAHVGCQCHAGHASGGARAEDERDYGPGDVVDGPYARFVDWLLSQLPLLREKDLARIQAAKEAHDKIESSMPEMKSLRIALLTVSDRCYRGEMKDETTVGRAALCGAMRC